MRLVLLCIITITLIVYLILGAIAFHYLERSNMEKTVRNLNMTIIQFLGKSDIFILQLSVWVSFIFYWVSLHSFQSCDHFDIMSDIKGLMTINHVNICIACIANILFHISQNARDISKLSKNLLLNHLSNEISICLNWLFKVFAPE